MNLSTNQISFIKDVHSSVNIDTLSSWKYHYFKNFDFHEIRTFIKLIEDNKIYMIIPSFSTSKSLSNASLYMSEAFLIDNKSNPLLITDFIFNQWNSSGFGLRPESKLIFSFKFKRVWYSYK
uniref:Uncharacterized protein n=1 Tax=Russula griseocarnosa TaxID=466936 RepID=A0A650AWK4_9AGAM|nr:hypothetical protein [Russula griseocarnosa]